jgi:hypothetical protein
MYINTPILELTEITKNILNNNNNQVTRKHKQKLVILLNTLLNQNYLQFWKQYYKQNDGSAIRVPTSAILAEIFIQYLEYTTILNILMKRHIYDDFRYVDDILIVHNTHNTNIENILVAFNSIHSLIKFTTKNHIIK